MKTLHLLITIMLMFGIFSMPIQNVQGSGVRSPPSTVVPPLKMLEEGYSIKNVKCNLGLSLVFKAENGSPTCVKSDTVQVLIKRGWAVQTMDSSKQWMEIDTPGLNGTYNVVQPISFSVTVKGFGNYSCVSPQIEIHNNKNPRVSIFHDNGSTMSCPSLSTPENYSFDFPERNDHYVIIVNKTGDYTITVSYGVNSVQKYFSVILPLNQLSITAMENDTGIVSLKNQTYYFETPHYTQDAYVNPVQISFHGVVFTLFPSGFRGGLPIPCTNNPEELQYYWADAKFADGTHELLHILGDSPPCPTRPIPTMFSTHTNPQAGLTFYDGKMKLLVSVEGMLQQNNSVFSIPTPSNETIYHDYPNAGEYSIIDATQGIAVSNDAEASNLTGFSVKSPTDLPQGYKVKLIKASKEIPMVTIFVSKYPLTENTTSKDFLWNQQGIFISYQKTGPHEFENHKHFWGASSNKTITIAGTPAVVFDISKEYNNGYQYDMWGSLLAIRDNNTSIAIDGFFNSDDLIKIATSMLEK